MEEEQIASLAPELQEEVRQLEIMIRAGTNKLYAIKRKYGIGLFCCRDSENSLGWNHNGKCKNWVLTF